MVDKEFKKAVEAILIKYAPTSLQKRWEEAISFGTGASAITYWIRDSEDLVNIVWLSPHSIRDITWFPALNQTIFNFLPLRNIASVEIREGPDIGKRFGYVVKGDLLIRIFCITASGNLAWISDTKQQEQELQAFASQVFKAYITAVGA